MTDCIYNNYCLCATCEFQKITTIGCCAAGCYDCLRAGKQVHDIWSCTKYQRKGFLRADLGKDNQDIGWRHIDDFLQCKTCGAKFSERIMEFFENNAPKFCPECGSDMRMEK